MKNSHKTGSELLKRRSAPLIFLSLFSALGSFLLPQESGSKFSHSVHLETVGLNCVACHTSAEESRTAAETNLPKPETCEMCHQAEEGDQRGKASDFSPEVPPRPVLFSHQRHLAVPDLTKRILDALESGRYPEGDRTAIRREIDPEEPCTACHRGLERTDLGRREHYPLMSDCLVCHTPKGNAMAECRTCHVSGFDLLPPDHKAATFFDQHSSEGQEHNVDRCHQCHTPGFNPCSQCH